MSTMVVLFTPSKENNLVEKSVYKFSNGSTATGMYFLRAMTRYVKGRKDLTKILIFAEEDCEIRALEELAGYENTKARRNDIKELERIISETYGAKTSITVLPSIRCIKTDEDNIEYQQTLLRAIIQHLSTDIENVYIDITYANNISVLLTLGIILPARYVSLKKIYIYYVNMNLGEKAKKVLEMPIFEKMIALDEQLASFELSGNFNLPLLTFLKEDQQKEVEEIYYQFELNDISEEPANKLRTIATMKETQNYFLINVNKELKRISQAKHVEELFYEKAAFYHKRKQYFKAIQLIFEAIVSGATVMLYGRGKETNLDYRAKAKNKIEKLFPPSLAKEFIKLRKMRNRIAHGINQNRRYYETKTEELETIFNDAIKIYQTIKQNLKS